METAQEAMGGMGGGGSELMVSKYLLVLFTLDWEGQSYWLSICQCWVGSQTWRDNIERKMRFNATSESHDSQPLNGKADSGGS